MRYGEFGCYRLRRLLPRVFGDWDGVRCGWTEPLCPPSNGGLAIASRIFPTGSAPDRWNVMTYSPGSDCLMLTTLFIAKNCFLSDVIGVKI